ncbi:hypothetical protein QR680_014629 [Steinernema hermaphroditum]|uniref:F-box domain-containing protein n=1 Tax=Steinernema hermaphroditum TaxID=289476 RepID=A0AA39I9L8_9BILA|nr:hypothetical protein QR680_014629 [Steinernema hermaphroditum]
MSSEPYLPEEILERIVSFCDLNTCVHGLGLANKKVRQLAIKHGPRKSVSMIVKQDGTVGIMSCKEKTSEAEIDHIEEVFSGIAPFCQVEFVMFTSFSQIGDEFVEQLIAIKNKYSHLFKVRFLEMGSKDDQSGLSTDVPVSIMEEFGCLGVTSVAIRQDFGAANEKLLVTARKNGFRLLVWRKNVSNSAELQSLFDALLEENTAIWKNCEIYFELTSNEDVRELVRSFAERAASKECLFERITVNAARTDHISPSIFPFKHMSLLGYAVISSAADNNLQVRRRHSLNNLRIKLNNLAQHREATYKNYCIMSV